MELSWGSPDDGNPDRSKSTMGPNGVRILDHVERPASFVDAVLSQEHRGGKDRVPDQGPLDRPPGASFLYLYIDGYRPEAVR